MSGAAVIARDGLSVVAKEEDEGVAASSTFLLVRPLDCIAQHFVLMFSTPIHCRAHVHTETIIDEFIQKPENRTHQCAWREGERVQESKQGEKEGEKETEIERGRAGGRARPYGQLFGAFRGALCQTGVRCDPLQESDPLLLIAGPVAARQPRLARPAAS